MAVKACRSGPRASPVWEKRVMDKIPNSNFRPAPQQVVVNAGELHHRGIVGLAPG